MITLMISSLSSFPSSPREAKREADSLFANFPEKQDEIGESEGEGSAASEDKAEGEDEDEGSAESADKAEGEDNS